MLRDQIAKQLAERLALALFFQDAGNVAGDRIGSSGFDFAVDARELLCGKADRDLRSGHTRIIPRGWACASLTVGLARNVNHLARTDSLGRLQ